MTRLRFTPRCQLSGFEWDSHEKKWDRPDLDRDVLTELFKPNTMYSFVRLLFYISLLVFTAAVTLYVSQYNLWLAIPVLYFYYFLFGFMIALAHEFQHRTVFSKSLKWLNDILFWIAQFLIWYSPRYHRVSHRLHHRYTMIYGTDLEVPFPRVFTSRYVYGFFWDLIFRALIIGAVFDFIRTIKNLIKQAFGKKDAVMKEACTSEDVRAIQIGAIVILWLHLMIIFTAVWLRRWEIVIFITTPWFIGGPIESIWHQTEHIGRIYDVNDQRLCTRSIKVGPFIKMIYWGLDDHVEHHIYPGVPSCNLPKLHKLLEKDNYLPEAKNVVGCWREIFAIGQEKDKNPDHEFVSIFA